MVNPDIFKLPAVSALENDLSARTLLGGLLGWFPDDTEQNFERLQGALNDYAFHDGQLPEALRSKCSLDRYGNHVFLAVMALDGQVVYVRWDLFGEADDEGGKDTGGTFIAYGTSYGGVSDYKIAA